MSFFIQITPTRFLACERSRLWCVVHTRMFVNGDFVCVCLFLLNCLLVRILCFCFLAAKLSPSHHRFNSPLCDSALTQHILYLCSVVIRNHRPSFAPRACGGGCGRRGGRWRLCWGGTERRYGCFSAGGQGSNIPNSTIASRLFVASGKASTKAMQLGWRDEW